MITNKCLLCYSTGVVVLPVGVDNPSVEDFDCPVCKPWRFGFPGLSAKSNWIVAPSEPGEPAEYIGWRIGNSDTPI